MANNNTKGINDALEFITNYSVKEGDKTLTGFDTPLGKAFHDGIINRLFTKAVSKDKGKFKIDVKKTTILANRYIDGVSFLIGSNGKLIKSEKKINDIPLVFGNFNNNEFLKLKEMIDISSLPYLDIDSIYYFNSKINKCQIK